MSLFPSGLSVSSAPAVVPRYVLDGTGPDLRLLVVTLAMCGVNVSPVVAGERYLLTGPRKTIEKIAAMLAETPGAAAAGFSIEPEKAPQQMAIRSAPIRTSGPRRWTEIQGSDGATTCAVAAAIDCRLSASYKGAGRWIITGSSEGQIRWAAAVLKIPTYEDALRAFQVTPEIIAREDRDGTPVVILHRHPMEAKTTVLRDEDGEILGSSTIYREPGSADLETSSTFKRDEAGEVDAVDSTEYEVP